MSDEKTTRDAILAAAATRRGLPYRLDPPPDGVATIDCSLFVVKTLQDAGVPLPSGVRTAEQIRHVTVPIDWADVKPGDLLFFEGTYDAGPPSSDGHIASHVGISLGRGTRQMWDAHERADGTGVGLTTLSDWWQPKLFEARRIPALDGQVNDGNGEQTDGQPWGVDVASHQGAVDWRAVAADGAAFGFTKATGGAWYVNPTFAANWTGMRAAGIKRGAYHFAFESSGQPFPGPGPEAEAEHFLSVVLPLRLEDGDMLVLDIEEGQGPLGEWAWRWCRRVETRTGIVPLIYTGAWFSDPHGFEDVPELARYPLWLAQYQETMPPAPAPWQTVAFWQHTDKGSVSGVAGNVDMNLFNGPAEMLALYGKPGKPGTVIAPPAVPDAISEQVRGLISAVAHLADVVAAIEDPEERLAQARAIREQFVGARPAA